MPIVISDNLVLSEVEAISADNPVILYRSLVTTGNVESTSDDADFPVANVANPATHLYWKGEVTGLDEYITITTNVLDDIDGLGVARHNFGSDNIVTSVEGATDVDDTQKISLHFDGDDGSTSITDSNGGGSAHVWSVVGTAQIDSAQSKFGGTSLGLDGIGDAVTTPDHVDFSLASNNFTAEGWVRPSVDGTAMAWVGQGNTTTTAATTSFKMERVAAGNKMQALVSNGTSFTTLTGVVTSIVAGAWYHVALVRLGNILTLYVNGAVEATAAFTDPVNNSANLFAVGAAGENTVNNWGGWVDEFALFNGEAKYTAPFTPPTHPYDQWEWLEIVQEQQLADDTPVLYRFQPEAYLAVRLRMQPGNAAPEAGVIYLHKLLVMERSIDIGAKHTPINLGRVTKVVGAKSTSGNFLGRVILNEMRQSTFDFKWITPTFYRSDVDPFVVASEGDPFFIAWNPSEYPSDVGYCWTVDDAMPGVDPVTRRFDLQIKTQGIA